MKYAAQRRHNNRPDGYLMAWHAEYGTVTIGDIKQAMTFDTEAEAVAAAERATREIKGAGRVPAPEMTFRAVPVRL